MHIINVTPTTATPKYSILARRTICHHTKQRTHTQRSRSFKPQPTNQQRHSTKHTTKDF
jgi:hypothetical protein